MLLTRVDSGSHIIGRLSFHTGRPLLRLHYRESGMKTTKQCSKWTIDFKKKLCDRLKSRSQLRLRRSIRIIIHRQWASRCNKTENAENCHSVRNSFWSSGLWPFFSTYLNLVLLSTPRWCPWFGFSAQDFLRTMLLWVWWEMHRFMSWLLLCKEHETKEYAADITSNIESGNTLLEGDVKSKKIRRSAVSNDQSGLHLSFQEKGNMYFVAFTGSARVDSPASITDSKYIIRMSSYLQ